MPDQGSDPLAGGAGEASRIAAWWVELPHPIG